MDGKRRTAVYNLSLMIKFAPLPLLPLEPKDFKDDPWPTVTYTETPDHKRQQVTRKNS